MSEFSLSLFKYAALVVSVWGGIRFLGMSASTKSGVLRG